MRLVKAFCDTFNEDFEINEEGNSFIDGFKLYSDPVEPELTKLDLAKDFICKTSLKNELGRPIDFYVLKYRLKTLSLMVA